MTRRARLVVVIVGMVVAVAAVSAWIHIHRGAIELAGDWKSWRTELHIARSEQGYAVRVVSPDGFLGGKYIGNLSGRVLTVRGPMSALCQTMAYSSEDDRLEFCGEQFERTAK